LSTLPGHPDEAPRSATPGTGLAEAPPEEPLGPVERHTNASSAPRHPEAAPEGVAFRDLMNTEAVEASNREAKRREADEDRELIKQAQGGDKQAFRRLVERHQRRAYSIALGLVRDENDARELVQEAFLRVYRGLATFEGGSSFFTWLYRIVTNLAIDLMRKPGRRDAELSDNQPAEDEGAELSFVSRIDGADPIDVLRRREIAARIQAALDALPPYHRGVILMREVEGMSYEEMAQAMGVSKGTIMSRLFHARQKLQRALADCYAEDRGHSPKPTNGAAASDDPHPGDPEDVS
jgi:RNA polymerase sigma-70 factor (ECF subfamily)